MPDSFQTVHREEITSLAARHRLPAIYAFRFFAEAGGLITADTEITPILATLVEQQVGAVFMGVTVLLAAQIQSLAARFVLPTMSLYSSDARAGALLSYANDVHETSRQIGVYAGGILKGEKPGDLPVIQPTKFEFVINLKTAKALGLTIPPNLLAVADVVIE
jgi:putative tryptophan/tyrosine transport system substrate-binding protein